MRDIESRLKEAIDISRMNQTIIACDDRSRLVVDPLIILITDAADEIKRLKAEAVGLSQIISDIARDRRLEQEAKEQS